MNEYFKRSKIDDERSLLANFIFQLIVDGFLENNTERKSYTEFCFIDQVALSKNVKKFYNLLEQNVRNIYELYDREIPLGRLYELLIYGKDNYSFTEEEYQAELKKVRKACKQYYKYKHKN